MFYEGIYQQQPHSKYHSIFIGRKFHKNDDNLWCFQQPTVPLLILCQGGRIYFDKLLFAFRFFVFFFFFLFKTKIFANETLTDRDNTKKTQMK